MGQWSWIRWGCGSMVVGRGSDGVMGLMGLWVVGAMNLVVVVCGGCK